MVFGKRQIWTILFCVYVVAVSCLCFMKPDALPQTRPELFGIPIDKLVHFLLFFPYPFIAYKAFIPKDMKLAAHLFVLVIVYVTGIGLAMGTEHVQGLLEYRSNDINDFYADMLGMSCSAALTAIFILTRKKKA